MKCANREGLSDLKLYPVDLLSVPLDDIDRWHEEFFVPDTSENLSNLNKKVQEICYDMIRKYSGTPVGDVLLVKIKLYMEFTKIISAKNLINKLKEKGYEAKYSKYTFVFEELLNPDAEFKSIVKLTDAEDLSPLQMIKKRLRNLAYSFRVNKNFLYFLNTKIEGKHLYNVNPSYETMLYAKNKSASFNYVPSFEWLSKLGSVKLEKEMTDKINEVSDELLVNIKKLLDESNIKMPNAALEYLRKITFEHLEVTAREIICVDRIMKQKGPLYVLGGNQCLSYNRLIALCNKKNGGYSVGFNHGNDTFSSRDLRMELSIADEFATYTKGGAELIANRDDTVFKPVNNNRPKITSLDTDRYTSLWDVYGKSRLPEEVKTIMVSGFPYDAIENLSFGPPDIIFLELEIFLIRRLIKEGYKVIYKPHPEVFYQEKGFKVSNIFGDGVDIVYDRFEEVADISDAFIFYYSFTSVFPWALTTKKPVVLLDSLDYRHHEERVMESLKKRCKVLDVYNDERNRLRFDIDAVLEYMTQKPSEPDTELLTKYFF